jgi:hypothetical protein
MPDGAVIIAAITSCTNTSNPRNVIAAAPAGAQRERARPDPQAVGEDLAGARLEGRAAVPGRRRLLPRAGATRLRHRGLRLHHLQRHERARSIRKIQQEIIDRDLYATAVLSGNRNFDGRIHPYAKQAFLASPPLVVAYAIAGTIRFDIERTCSAWTPTANRSR